MLISVMLLNHLTELDLFLYLFLSNQLEYCIKFLEYFLV